MIHDHLVFVLSSVYKKTLEDIQGKAFEYLAEKTRETNRTYLSIYIPNYGNYNVVYKTVHPTNISKTGLFSRNGGFQSCTLTKDDDEELYNYIIEISEQIAFIYQFITYLSLKLNISNNNTSWIYMLYPKIVRDKLRPNIVYVEPVIPEEDKDKYEIVRKYLQIQAVNTFLI